MQYRASASFDGGVGLTRRLQSLIPRNAHASERLGFRQRVVGICIFLIAANLSVWAWAFTAFAHQPVLIGTAVLAYSLGLRHAIDADHIAAIDNVTRKLMQEGKRPVSVGFFFALGHSTVVVLASLAVGADCKCAERQLVSYREIGGIIGTSASALFLFIIAIANLIVLARRIPGLSPGRARQ